MTLPLFPEEPKCAPAPPVERIKFTGPYERRALVITGSVGQWEAWRRWHAAEYGSAIWVLDDAAASRFNLPAFVSIRLDADRGER